ncbi:MAG: hypothetical protein JSW07_03900, partial [bacterium]
MNIAYTTPFSRAWNRMTTALFKPFDLGKWFVVGFTAFLAGLTEGHGGGGGSSRTKIHRHHDFGDVIDFPRTIWEWLMDNPGWFTLIVFGALFVIALAILLTWLSSRGKFMFLDNVVYNRSKVTQPWHEFRMEGNSLFLWRIVFGLIVLSVITLFLIQIFYIASDIYEAGFESDFIMPIMGMGLLALLVILVIAYISAFLNNFVIPIMYKHRITTTQAWRQFLPLFSEHWGYFILYGLFLLVLHILAVIVVITVGLFTC